MKRSNSINSTALLCPNALRNRTRNQHCNGRKKKRGEEQKYAIFFKEFGRDCRYNQAHGPWGHSAHAYTGWGEGHLTPKNLVHLWRKSFCFQEKSIKNPHESFCSEKISYAFPLSELPLGMGVSPRKFLATQ